MIEGEYLCNEMKFYAVLVLHSLLATALHHGSHPDPGSVWGFCQVKAAFPGCCSTHRGCWVSDNIMTKWIDINSSAYSVIFNQVNGKIQQKYAKELFIMTV